MDTQLTPTHITDPEGGVMPLARIDVYEERSGQQPSALADVVHHDMLEVFAPPAGDRYQIVNEHVHGRMFNEDTGLGIDRSDEAVVIQVLPQGRDDRHMQALHAALPSTVQDRVGLLSADLVEAVSSHGRSD